MAVKIRLARHGRKKRPFYHIVVADGRAPRDGRFIEKLGTYNPMTNPATIDIDLDQAVKWLLNGAQPTDTCDAILRYKGVAYKKHLAVGVLKGAITQEQADEKFAIFLNEKEGRIEAKKVKVAGEKEAAKKAKFVAEVKVKETRAAKIAEKNAPAPVVEETAEEAGEEASAEDNA